MQASDTSVIYSDGAGGAGHEWFKPIHAWCPGHTKDINKQCRLSLIKVYSLH